MNLYVRLPDAIYYFLNHEALRQGRSMASLLSEILLNCKLGKIWPHRQGGTCTHQK